MTEYYVATTGNDSNEGTEGSPWLTLSKAATEALAGDTVYFRGGTYSAQKLTAVRSGSADNPITFRNYAGEMPIFDEGYFTKGIYGGVVRVTGHGHLIFDGLTIHNAGWMGFLLDKGAHHVTVQNCVIDFTFSSGIMADGCDSVTITNNDLQRVTHGIGGASPNEWISYRNSSSGEIAYNHLHNPNRVAGAVRGKEGIDVKSGSFNVDVHHNIVEDMDRTGLYTDGYADGVSNITFRYNYVARCLHGILVGSEQGGPVKNVDIHNNVFWNNEYHGIWIAHDPDIAPQGKMAGIHITNNTVVGNRGNGSRVSNGNLVDVDYRKNIFWGNAKGTWNISNGAVFTRDANHEDKDADPLFVDMANGDFHLTADSPIADIGAFVYVPDPVEPDPVEPDPTPDTVTVSGIISIAAGGRTINLSIAPVTVELTDSLSLMLATVKDEGQMT